MVLAALREGNDPYAIYGELVHNPQVLEALAERGVTVCDDPWNMEKGTLFLRTHGTTLERCRELAHLPLAIRDLTCPRVGKALALARKKSGEGYQVIILGDPDHQEVKCIRSYGGEGARVISGPDQVDSLADVSRPFLLSQTTQNTEAWERTRDRMQDRFPDLEHCCTICNSTSLRQEELRRLCHRVDCVVVVGGRNSANTARLAEIAGEEGLPSFHVETHEDLDPVELAKYENILLTAGASTPSWSIRKVRERLLEIQGGRLSTGRVRRFLQNAVYCNFHFLPVTFTLGAAGACVLALRGWFWQVLASTMFLFAVHLVTSILESGYSHPSGLGRQEFLRKYRFPLTVLSIASFASALLISVHLDPVWPLVLGIMLAAFLLYSMPLFRKAYPFRGLRALPGSRDLMFAGAWSFLLALLPGFINSGLETGNVLWAGMLFFLFLGRCLLADLVDLQGDALMGMDTIPIHAGRERSVMLFWLCFALAASLMIFGTASGHLSRVTLYFVPGLVCLAAGYIVLGRVPFPSELAKRTMADGSLLLAGLVPALIAIIGGIQC
jgi:4-hydroxy-3-methylbut-2-enyl diphosphate reductase